MAPQLIQKLLFFVFVIGGVLLEAAGDILFKKWALDSKNWIIILGILSYFAGGILWAFSLKYEYLGRAISLFTILNLVIVVIAGMFIFKEDISLVNKIGISLGILSIILIEL